MALWALQTCVLLTISLSITEGTPPPGHVPQLIDDKHPPKYEYGYVVSDKEGSSQGHVESRDGIYALGRYYVNLPHSGQRVTYFADDWGYHPLVSYSSTTATGSSRTEFAMGDKAVAALKNPDNAISSLLPVSTVGPTTSIAAGIQVLSAGSSGHSQPALPAVVVSTTPTPPTLFVSSAPTTVATKTSGLTPLQNFATSGTLLPSPTPTPAVQDVSVVQSGGELIPTPQPLISTPQPYAISVLKNILLQPQAVQSTLQPFLTHTSQSGDLLAGLQGGVSQYSASPTIVTPGESSLQFIQSGATFSQYPSTGTYVTQPVDSSSSVGYPTAATVANSEAGISVSQYPTSTILTNSEASSESNYQNNVNTQFSQESPTPISTSVAQTEAAAKYQNSENIQQVVTGVEADVRFQNSQLNEAGVTVSQYPTTPAVLTSSESDAKYQNSGRDGVTLFQYPTTAVVPNEAGSAANYQDSVQVSQVSSHANYENSASAQFNEGGVTVSQYPTTVVTSSSEGASSSNYQYPTSAIITQTLHNEGATSSQFNNAVQYNEVGVVNQHDVLQSVRGSTASAAANAAAAVAATHAANAASAAAASVRNVASAHNILQKEIVNSQYLNGAALRAQNRLEAEVSSLQYPGSAEQSSFHSQYPEGVSISSSYQSSSPTLSSQQFEAGSILSQSEIAKAGSLQIVTPEPFYQGVDDNFLLQNSSQESSLTHNGQNVKITSYLADTNRVLYYGDRINERERAEDQDQRLINEIQVHARQQILKDLLREKFRILPPTTPTSFSTATLRPIVVTGGVEVNSTPSPVHIASPSSPGSHVVAQSSESFDFESDFENSHQSQESSAIFTGVSSTLPPPTAGSLVSAQSYGTFSRATAASALDEKSDFYEQGSVVQHENEPSVLITPRPLSPELQAPTQPADNRYLPPVEHPVRENSDSSHNEVSQSTQEYQALGYERRLVDAEAQQVVQEADIALREQKQDNLVLKQELELQQVQQSIQDLQQKIVNEIDAHHEEEQKRHEKVNEGSTRHFENLQKLETYTKEQNSVQSSISDSSSVVSVGSGSTGPSQQFYDNSNPEFQQEQQNANSYYSQQQENANIYNQQDQNAQILYNQQQESAITLNSQQQEISNIQQQLKSNLEYNQQQENVNVENTQNNYHQESAGQYSVSAHGEQNVGELETHLESSQSEGSQSSSVHLAQDNAYIVTPAPPTVHTYEQQYETQGVQEVRPEVKYHGQLTGGGVEVYQYGQGSGVQTVQQETLLAPPPAPPTVVEIEKPVLIEKPVAIESTKIVEIEKPVYIKESVPVEHTKVVEVERPVTVLQPYPVEVTKLVHVDRPVAVPTPYSVPQPIPIPFAIPHAISIPVPHLVPYPEIIPFPFKEYHPVYIHTSHHKMKPSKQLPQQIFQEASKELYSQSHGYHTIPLHLKLAPTKHNSHHYTRSTPGHTKYHVNTRNKNALKNLRIEYGFKPPLIPSAEIKEEPKPSVYGPSVRPK